MTDDHVTHVERIRPQMKRRRGYFEKKMFGGICFMINGNMCVGPCKGSLIVRLNREKNDEIQLEPHAKPMGIMRELMRGWAKIEPTGIASDDELKTRVGRAAKFARSLPPE